MAFQVFYAVGILYDKSTKSWQHFQRIVTIELILKLFSACFVVTKCRYEIRWSHTYWYLRWDPQSGFESFLHWENSALETWTQNTPQTWNTQQILYIYVTPKPAKKIVFSTDIIYKRIARFLIIMLESMVRNEDFLLLRTL